VLRRFNSQQLISKDLSENLEAYFQYRWKHDVNQAIKSRDEVELLEQLPKNVQHDIYRKFLFTSLVKVYACAI